MKKINKTKYNAGMLTLEIIIAFAILVLNISAVLLLTAGGQNIYVDIETNTEALSKAQANLETEITKSKINFDATSPSTTNDGIYTKKISVFDLTPCKKEIDSTVSWSLSPLRTLEVALNSFVASPDQIIALGGDCSTTPPQGDDWKKPEDLNYSGVDLKTEGNGRAIDAQNSFAYLVTKATGSGKADFYIFDTTDINNPIKKSSSDFSDGEGFEDIDTAGNYAYLANDEKKNKKQLYIVDISDPINPLLISTFNLNTSGSCPYTCPGGRSIYYYKNTIYMGLHRMPTNGSAEFQIIDVSNPGSPSLLGSKGGSTGDPLDHNINEIFIKEFVVSGIKYKYAFLATSNDSGELTILNVTNPGSIPNPAGSPATGVIFDIPGIKDATSLNIIGNKLYLGLDRATGTEKDFYIIDISTPSIPQILGSRKLGLANNTYVSGIRSVSNLALISTTDSNQPFLVLDISDPVNITDWVVPGCGLNFSVSAMGIDYENNLIYLPLNNATSNVNLKIIKPIGGSC